MAADPLTRDPLATPAWFTLPVMVHERRLILELERTGLPWRWERWERWDIPAAPELDAEASTYGVIYAEVGHLESAAPDGVVPIHTREDIRYAWSLHLAVHRRAEPEPEQLTLELSA